MKDVPSSIVPSDTYYIGKLNNNYDDEDDNDSNSNSKDNNNNNSEVLLGANIHRPDAPNI